MKKIMSVMLIVVLLLSLSGKTYASEKCMIKDDKEKNFVIHSEEFPEAYIIIEDNSENDARKQDLKNIEEETQTDLGSVSATIFLEETYCMIDGEVITMESRLLSKEEVDEVGINNFNSIAVEKPTVEDFSRSASKSAINSRGKLTISFSGSYNTSGNGVTCNLSGNANWDSWVIALGENRPASGSDYIGIAWLGGFSANSSSASATFSKGGNQNIYLSAANPNAGRVWSFNEYVVASGGAYSDYVNNVNVSTTLSKSNLTGGGNTAEAVLKYIHTYQSSTGSISISASSSGVGAGYTLSGTSKQWSLVCVVNGIPY